MPIRLGVLFGDFSRAQGRLEWVYPQRLPEKRIVGACRIVALALQTAHRLSHRERIALLRVLAHG